MLTTKNKAGKKLARTESGPGRELVPTAGGMPAVVREFQSDAVAIELQPEPLIARGTLWLAAAMLVVALVWASIATIDRVVTARGRILSTSPNLVVQPLEISVIRSINVKPGDIVKTGEVLATLDPTFTGADVTQLKVRKASLDAQIARLGAELAGQNYTAVADLDRTEALLQESIARQRKAQYDAQLKSYEGKAAKLKATLATRRADIQILTERLGVLSAIEKMRTDLEKTQVGSRLNSLQAADSRLDLTHNLESTRNSIAEVSAEYDSAVADREAFIQDWRRRAAEELVQATRDRDQANEQLVKAARRRDLVTLTAPVDAMVLETAQRSVGSVIKEAETLFTLVPLNAPLEVEAMIDARDLGSLKSNEPVRIKLDAFPFQQHGTLNGIVRSVSEDTVTRRDDSPVQGAQPTEKNSPAYRARVEITSSDMRNLPNNFRLIPGMPLTAELKLGVRPLIAYFTDPITRSLDEGLRDP